MNSINLAIIDDEKIQVELLEKYVNNWAAKKNIDVSIHKFYNAESFEFSWIMDKRYDVILLDIKMKGQNGIELAKEIRKKDDILNIIFITGAAEYIGEGYDVSALNYLIKPINKDKLYKCFDKVVFNVSKEEKSILIEFDKGIERIKQNQIMYIEAFAHLIEINTINKKYTVKKNISEIEKELDNNIFIRCHRSYIVNLKYVKKIKDTELEMDNGAAVPVSRRKYSMLNMAFIKYYKGDIYE